MESDNSATGNRKNGLLKAIPNVEKCLRQLLAIPEIDQVPVSLVKNCVREVLAELREDIIAGADVPAESLKPDQLMPVFTDRIRKELRPRFRRVINGTGVIIHTNLGRSILPADTMQMLHEAGLHYSNLEFDLETGERGSRYSLVEKLLCDLTGAEAALVVNNNAAAVLIVLETLAKNREVIVSRGQLVEIGGSFRIPDVMARSGAHLVEVGATNRTHPRDYRDAITEETALLLKVHCSNFRIIGFTRDVSLDELVAIGREQGIPVMEDLGSGCFVDLTPFGLEREPTVQEVVASGTDVLTFSGDKLLGGPQAGIILGKKEIVAKIKKNPLNRALRIDKFTLAGLESILRLYLDERTVFERIPTLAMIAQPQDTVKKRARKLAKRIGRDFDGLCEIEICETVSRVGGGAMPEQNLPSFALKLKPQTMSVSRLETLLRQLDVPVIGRIEDDHLLLDMRTVSDDELILLDSCLRQVLTAQNG